MIEGGLTMSKYKEITGIFKEFESHVVDSRSLIEKPYKDDEEGVYIWAQILNTLDDGMEVELCMWTDCDCHISFWDVSVDKKFFDSKAETDFLTYLRDKGLFLEDLKVRYSIWHYCGLIPMDDVYRIQYYEEYVD